MDIRRLLSGLRRNALLIVAAIVTAAVAAWFVANLQAREYTAAARVLLDPNRIDTTLDPSSGGTVTDPDRFAADQIEIIRSPGTLDAASDQVDRSIGGDRVAARQTTDTNVIAVSVRDTDADRAAESANAIVSAYIERQQQRAVEGLQRAADQIAVKLEELQRRIADLDAQVAAGTTGTQALESERLAAQVQYQTLFARQEELRVSISLQDGGVEVIERATPPASPSSPKPTRSAALGAIVGLLIGLGVALLREQLDDRLIDDEMVEQVFGAPILGRVPEIKLSTETPSEVLADWRTDGAATEAIRSLRTAVQFLGVDRPIRRILVTSPSESEGKTFVAVNLAVALSQATQRVVLISADLRRPRAERVFGLDETAPGLSDLIRALSARAPAAVPASGGTAPATATPEEHGVNQDRAVLRALQPTDVPGLRVLPAGSLPPNPAELLASEAMRRVLAALEAHTDLIVLDSPPAGLVTDATLLSAAADGVLFVAWPGRTGRREASRAVESLRAAGAHVLGVALNGARLGRRAHYYRHTPSTD